MEAARPIVKRSLNLAIWLKLYVLELELKITFP